MTLPSRPLLAPRTMVTSSSLRMGMLRAWEVVRRCYYYKGRESSRELTLYFSRSSLERGALMMTRRSLEGALK